MNRLALSTAALCLILCCRVEALACTSAVVSGRATPDGRPLLWKHRDTGHPRNHVALVQGEKYDFVADVNSDTFPTLKEAWIGTNSAGFSLMNTQSYNLVEVKDGEERGEANGRVIYRALEICATVEDFCHFLDTLGKPSGIEANFGVIDAKGGAAILEVDYYNYTLFDVNDPGTAPLGYLARTNFSFSGPKDKGAGYVRYDEATRVLDPAAKARAITPQLIFRDLSRSFHNPQLGLSLRDDFFQRPESTGWFVDDDFIPRHSTSCSIVVQGVAEGEPAGLTTMWTVLGYPPTSIALPVWVSEGVPELLSYDQTLEAAPLSAWSLDLQKRVWSLKKGNGSEKYFNWGELYKASGDGYMQKAQEAEDKCFKHFSKFISTMRKEGKIDSDKLPRLYTKVQDEIRRAYDGMLSRTRP